MAQNRNIEDYKIWRREYYKSNKRDYLDRQAIYEVSYKIKMKYELVMMLGGKCNFCNYAENPFVLEFHHLGNKKDNISNMFSRGKSKDKLISEAKKCILLCPICHNREHTPSIKLWEKYKSIGKILEVVKSKKIKDIKKRNAQLI